MKIKKKRKKVKNLFSKLVVAYCLVFCSATAIWSLWIADTDGLLVTEVLSVIFAFFGGELLILCLRQVLGKKQNKEENNGTDSFNWPSP